MQIALLLYEGLTALDIMGPYEVLCRLPDVDLRFVAKEAGPITVDTGVLKLVTEHSLADVPEPDVFVVPGGTAGTFAAAQDEEILDWLRHAHRTTRFSTSVCTGSLILAAAGILEGLEATTHWGARAMLEQYGVTFSASRVVRQGKVITAAGVSSGIDMALTLVAELFDEDMARMTQLGIEYDPEPPFDAGSPAKAGEALAARSLAVMAENMQG